MAQADAYPRTQASGNLPWKAQRNEQDVQELCTVVLMCYSCFWRP